ncbi:M48 family metalloprotease [Hasllibacter halocynthiae]|uniref:M48 family metalloprotease n=1 Tax=Hasllibacter halocynthiae TaxID=595589 RepID=UPI001304C34B|nr:M48 family metalloprotease [Hasllibacter halocynthiae]
MAEGFCLSQIEALPDLRCEVAVRLDRTVPDRDAFAHEVGGAPVITMTLPMAADFRNDDEMAFVIGHEYGHHVARHIAKGERQALAGALVLGLAVAYGQASADPYGTQTAAQRRAVEGAFHLGAAVGERAYSQAYELEADTLGARIAAAAGYDPVRGARFFARPEPVSAPSGHRSFWGTHPPDDVRVATVMATARAD